MGVSFLPPAYPYMTGKSWGSCITPSPASALKIGDMAAKQWHQPKGGNWVKSVQKRSPPSPPVSNCSHSFFVRPSVRTPT